MRRLFALALVVVAAAAAPSFAKISTRDADRLATGTTPTGLSFRFLAVQFPNARPDAVPCVVLQRRHTFRRPGRVRSAWVGEHHCDYGRRGDWTLKAAWGGHCGSGDASVLGFVRAPAVRVTWWDGQVASASVVPLTGRVAPGYSAFFANAAVRTAPRLVEALDEGGAVLASARFSRRQARWVCTRGYRGFYVGNDRSG